MANAEGGVGHSLRVGYVEDAIMDRLLLEHHLNQQAGVEAVEIEIASTCEKIAREVEKALLDVLILDDRLPCGDGHLILATMDVVTRDALSIVLHTGAEENDPRLAPYGQYPNLQYVLKGEEEALKTALNAIRNGSEEIKTDIITPLSYKDLQVRFTVLRGAIDSSDFQTQAQSLTAQFTYYLTSTADTNPLSRQLAHLARGLMSYLLVDDDRSYHEAIFVLIDHILSFDGEEESQKPMPVSKVLTGIRDLYAPFSEIKQGEVPKIVIEGEGDFSLTHSRDLQIVLHNLILNAKAAGANQVTLVCEETDTSVQLRISDDGPGLPDAFILPEPSQAIEGREHGNGLPHILSIACSNEWTFGISSERNFVLEIPKEHQQAAKVA